MKSVTSTIHPVTSPLIETFLELSDDVLWTYDNALRIFTWTASPEVKLRYGLADISTIEDWVRRIHEDDVAHAESANYSATNDPTQKILEITYRLRDPSGNMHSIRDKRKFVRDETGKALRVTGLWRQPGPEPDSQPTITAQHSSRQMWDEVAATHAQIEAAREELRQTNEQLSMNYQQLFEHDFILTRSQQLAKIGSWEYEYSTGRFLWSNEMYSIFGIDKSVDVNDFEYLKSLFCPSSQHFITETYGNLVNQKGDDFESVVEIVTPLGYKKWLRIAGYHIDGKTRQQRMIGLTHDITYFKEAEVRLRSSEEKFSKAFNNNPDPMLLIRQRDMVIIDANKKTLPAFGYSPFELLGNRFTDFNFLNAEYHQRLALGSDHTSYNEFECPWRKKDGNIIHVLVSCSLVEIEGTRTYIVDVKDITGRVEAEEKLRLSEANLRATMNNTSVMVWSVDRYLDLVMKNRAFAEYIHANYGIQPEEGPDLPEEIRAQLLVRWQFFYKRALSGETFSTSEEWNGRNIDYSLNPIIENGIVVGVSVFAEDVTEKLQQQRELANTQRTLAEYKLMALRSVMNPHFVFNALNSIQFFITTNDRLNAINYLSTFSKLIRGILNNSKNHKIRLSEEIELLQHYVELELLRFENKFDFILYVDPELDIENIEIQTLLIQPFVENAILHGLYNSTRKGLLNISIESDPGGTRILFTIEDNGIGREAAKELRQKTSPGHRSVGISLTQERLRLINNNDALSVEIIDQYDGDVALGTKIRISVGI